MSIYKVEATKEEMVQEALVRMKLLKLNEDIVNAFETRGQVFTSQSMAGQTFLQPPDEEAADRIKTFEEEYGCLVYHAHWCRLQMLGEMWSLLFVSPTASDWKGEKQYLTDCGLAYAYVDSDMESGIGEIQVESRDGGIDRIG